MVLNFQKAFEIIYRAHYITDVQAFAQQALKTAGKMHGQELADV